MQLPYFMRYRLQRCIKYVNDSLHSCVWLITDPFQWILERNKFTVLNEQCILCKCHCNMNAVFFFKLRKCLLFHYFILFAKSPLSDIVHVFWLYTSIERENLSYIIYCMSISFVQTELLEI